MHRSALRCLDAIPEDLRRPRDGLHFDARTLGDECLPASLIQEPIMHERYPVRAATACVAFCSLFALPTSAAQGRNAGMAVTSGGTIYAVVAMPASTCRTAMKCEQPSPVSQRVNSMSSGLLLASASDRAVFQCTALGSERRIANPSGV